MLGVLQNRSCCAESSMVLPHRTVDSAPPYSRPRWKLEDGFLRSVGLGKAGSIPLPIIAEDRRTSYLLLVS